MTARAGLTALPFSGAVLVTHEGRVLYREAFGLADREYGIPNTIETRFRTGSAGKQFTSAAILLLEDRGKLKVTDPVSKYLPEWPRAWSAMTIHHLLSHTAGLPRLTTEGLADVSGLSAAAPKPFATLSDLLKPGEELQPPDFEPGTKWAYSNVGYLILGMIVERASGVPYADFLREQMFDPVGMRNTRVDDPNALVRARARGYRRAEDGGYSNAIFVDPRFVASAGGIYSTVDDLGIWNNVLDSDRLLSPAARSKLFSDVRYGYGYGWFIGRTFDRETQWHRGNIPGFVSIIVRYPHERITFVAMSNTDRTPVLSIANELAAIAFREPYETPRDRIEVPLKSVPVELYLGEYRKVGQPDETFRLVRNGTELRVQIPKYGASFTVVPESADSLFARSLDFSLRFVRTGQGAVAHVLVRNNGETTRWDKTE
jgi:CubicO group peptidase (beta-lactamase class C family)